MFDLGCYCYTAGLIHDYDKAKETGAARRKGVRSSEAHRWKVKGAGLGCTYISVMFLLDILFILPYQ